MSGSWQPVGWGASFLHVALYHPAGYHSHSHGSLRVLRAARVGKPQCTSVFEVCLVSFIVQACIRGWSLIIGGTAKSYYKEICSHFCNISLFFPFHFILRLQLISYFYNLALLILSLCFNTGSGTLDLKEVKNSSMICLNLSF